jgi:PhoH-like ATPase
MTKVYILDTNVLLHDPNSVFKFADNTVVIPMTVIEEVDRFKRDQSEIGRNARTVSRTLDKLRVAGTLSTTGVSLPNSGQLRVQLPTADGLKIVEDAFGIETTRETNDLRILSVAVAESLRSPSTKCIMITKDINLRIRANSLGLDAEDYESDKIQHDTIFSGYALDVYIATALLNSLYSQPDISVSCDELKLDMYPNQILFLTAHDSVNHTGVAKVLSVEDGVAQITKVDLPNGQTPVWGLSSRNREQRIALAHLLDPSIALVTLVGKAGTGKTLLALAAGLQLTADEQLYTRTLVSRPVYPLGKDLGFLPGDVIEKMSPWMQPIYDNLDFLLNTKDEYNRKLRGHQELMEFGILEIEALTYIRGRSIPKQYMIVDEAQNLTPHEVKTILTRAGQGTKIVLTGDPNQIDNPYVDSENNGLSYAAAKFKNDPLAAHILLTVGERSALAERASKLL